MDESDEEYLTSEMTPYSETNSARGAASLSPREMSKAIGARERHLSRKQTNMLNAAARDARLESLQLRIRDLVDHLGVDQRVQEAVQTKAELCAQKMKSADLKESDVAFAAVIKVMRDYGWSFEKIVARIAALDRRMAAVDDLRLSVLLDRKGPRGGKKVAPNGRNASRVIVRIGGLERTAEVLDNGTAVTKLLRVPLYTTDNGEVLELKGAVMCTRSDRNKSGSTKLVCTTEDRRLDILDACRAVVRTGRSFEALKLMKRVEFNEGVVSAESAARDERTNLLLKRYWTEKLPLTEYFLASAGMLMQFRTRYSQLFREKFDREKVVERLRSSPEGEPLLRSPRLLAREALAQADKELFGSVPGHLKAKVRRLAEERGLKEGVEGFVVWSELKVWEE